MGKPIIGVYKISNTLCPEGKYYIGYSCNIKQRLQKHKSTLRGGKHCNIRMQRAYEKYGSECFDYEILQECENEEEAKNIELSYLEDLTIRDKLYNLHYNSSGGDMLTFHPDREQIIEKRAIEQKKRNSELTPEEYKRRFCTKTGEKNGMYGRTHTDEVKRLYSEMHKGNTYCLGKKASQETKEKLSIIASERLGEKNPFFGKHHSEETKQKVREKSKGRLPPNIREVIINEETYISATEAGRQLGICTGTILHRIKSPNPLYANYFYVENEPKHNTSISAETRQKMCEARNKRESPNSKPVVIDGIQYKSTSEASRQLGVSTGIIRNRLKSNIPINEPPKKRESPMSKKVIIDGILYKSTAEASRQLGISKSIIGNRLYNKFQIFDNYNFADTKIDEVMLPSLV